MTEKTQFWDRLLMVFVCSMAAFSSLPLRAEEFVHKFKNGNQLIFDPPYGLYFRSNESGEKKFLSPLEGIIYFPWEKNEVKSWLSVSPTKQTFDIHFYDATSSAYSSSALIKKDDGYFYFVSQDGVYKQTHANCPGEMTWMSEQFFKNSLKLARIFCSPHGPLYVFSPETGVTQKFSDVAKWDSSIIQYYVGDSLVEYDMGNAVDFDRWGSSSAAGDDYKPNEINLTLSRGLLDPKIIDPSVQNEEGISEKSSEIIRDFVSDLGVEVRSSKRILPLCEGDHETVEALTMLLVKPGAGSGMVTGDAGSGKSEFVKTFVKKATQGEIPAIPAGTRFLWVKPEALNAGTKHTGTFEARVNALIEYAKENKAVLVVDEAHTLKGAGTHSHSSIDFYERIKAPIADGTIRFIGMTTNDEYQTYFASDPALTRRFPEIKKKSIPKDQLIPALKNWAKSHSSEVLNDELYQTIIQISSQFDPIATDLAKAVRLASEVEARRRLEVKEAKQLTREDIKKAAQVMYQADPALFDKTKAIEKLGSLRGHLDGIIAGNEDLKEDLMRDARIILMGTRVQGMPHTRRLFVGSPGLAKTYLSKKYAEYMGLPVKEISMSEYASGKTTQSLLEEVGSAIRKNAYTVIVFDELEKAPKALQDALLRLMSSDSFTMTETNPSSRVQVISTIKSSHASFFFTSNAGQHAILRDPEVDEKGLRQAILRDGISEPLLDRMSGIHKFIPPQSKIQFINILRIKLKEALEEQCKNHQDIKIQVLDGQEFLDKIADKYFHQGSLRTAVADLNLAISDALAQEKIKNELPKDCKVGLLNGLKVE